MVVVCILCSSTCYKCIVTIMNNITISCDINIISYSTACLGLCHTTENLYIITTNINIININIIIFGSSIFLIKTSTYYRCCLFCCNTSTTDSNTIPICIDCLSTTYINITIIRINISICNINTVTCGTFSIIA